MSTLFKDYIKNREENLNVIRDDVEKGMLSADVTNAVLCQIEIDICMLVHEMDRLNNILENMERKRR